MKFTLRNLKIMQALSEETLCYDATLHIDDKPAFKVSNRGHGGCDDIWPLGTYKTTDVEAYIRENPPTGVTVTGFDSPIDDLVSHLIAVAEAEKLLKRHIKKSFVYIEGNQVSTVSPARGRPFSEDWANHVAERFPERRRVTLTQNWDEAVTIVMGETSTGEPA